MTNLLSFLNTQIKVTFSLSVLPPALPQLNKCPVSPPMSGLDLEPSMTSQSTPTHLRHQLAVFLLVRMVRTAIPGKREALLLARHYTHTCTRTNTQYTHMHTHTQYTHKHTPHTHTCTNTHMHTHMYFFNLVLL